METVLSPREMYALERAYFEAGNDSLALMERAARCLTEELEAITGGLQGKTVAFLCGGGNNAVTRMVATDIRGVEGICIKTDKQVLVKGTFE